MSSFAQKDISSVKKVNFFGVDFSHANLYAFEETPEVIQTGLERINNLFINERKKFDICKHYKIKSVEYCLETTNINNVKLPVEKTYSNPKYTELSNKQIKAIISELNCDSDDCGLVFIAENLNKPDKKAIFIIVFFDGRTKDIIYSKRASAKPTGFGVRNYWAGAINSIIKKWKY